MYGSFFVSRLAVAYQAKAPEVTTSLSLFQEINKTFVVTGKVENVTESAWEHVEVFPAASQPSCSTVSRHPDAPVTFLLPGDAASFTMVLQCSELGWFEVGAAVLTSNGTWKTSLTDVVIVDRKFSLLNFHY